MRFYNVNWSTRASDSRMSSFPACDVSRMPTQMDVTCECGHRWHAIRGKAVGQITRAVQGEVTCPKCGNVDAYTYRLPMTA